ncbi:hypothetical protein MIR68_006625 [Amoeboaphelidium protococcarum]|nr:hypothetical protein MIR68_006625 [Amoeboaphelidium protococcarum]
MATSQEQNELRNKINQKLIESGEKDQLREYLRQRLSECGWKDGLKQYCRDIVKSKTQQNPQNPDVTVEDLVAEISPYARSSVPNEVKAELVKLIEEFVANNQQ